MRKFALNKAFESKAALKKLYSALIILAVAAVIILVNVLADELPWSYDMTTERLFTLSEQTKAVLSGLQDEVHIVVLAEEGNEDKTIQTLLDEYRKYAKGMISVETMGRRQEPRSGKKIRHEG